MYCTGVAVRSEPEMVSTEREQRTAQAAVLAEDLSAQHFADTASARQAGEAAAAAPATGTADQALARCYELVRTLL